MKTTFPLALVLSFCLFGCQSPSGQNDKIRNIDLLKAFDQSREISLSDLFKSVEIVQFYPADQTFFVNARSFTVGKKYIVIADDGGGGRSNIILCERSGKYVTTIGRTGKGPGEFLQAWLVMMDPSEQYVIIADDRSNKLIKYSVSGEFIKERKMDELPGRNLFDQARFINDHEFVVVPRRPVRAIDGFASMYVYDLELNPAGKILPRANDKNLPLFNNMYQTLGQSQEGIFYWEPWFDTLYTIRPDHRAEASYVIGWSKDGPSFEYMSTSTYGLPPDRQYPVNFIYSLTEVGNYFFIGGLSYNKRFSAVYDKKTDVAFQISGITECDTATSGKRVTIKNDLFGIEPVFIQSFEPAAGRYACWVRPGWIASEYDLDCIRNRQVKFPEIRDRLLEIIKSPDPDNNMVLVLMEAK